MSELSIDELQAETGELLPERETLATLGGITITNVGIVASVQVNSNHSYSHALGIQETNVAVDSFDHYFFILGSGLGS